MRRWIATFGQLVDERVPKQPWTVTYGFARTIIALATLLTLISNSSGLLFRVGIGIHRPIICNGLGSRLSIFCLSRSVGSPGLEISYLTSIILLTIVASGWRPRLTGIFHWWISFSLFTSSALVDGGDQVAACLTLLLLPATLTDRRKWHWSKTSGRRAGKLDVIRCFAASSALFVVQMQVALIYLNACIAKLAVPEWIDGTGLYYWLSSNFVGFPNWVRPLMEPLLSSPIVAILTWSVLVLEFLLGVAIFSPSLLRRVLLRFGVWFHIAIGSLMGIPSFGLTMVGALILYLVSVGREDEWISHFLAKVEMALRSKCPRLKNVAGEAY